MTVADLGLYPLDLLLVAAMARSFSLVDGFLDAFDRWNPVVAAPILRMQLDSLVRVAYVAHAPSADQIVLDVIGGGEFRHFKDSDGKRLTDARLLEHAEADHPWVADVYNATSGWVHFSPEHVRATWRIRDEADESRGTIATISGGLPIRREHIPLSALQELLGAMIQATKELFGYAEAWESRKGLPLGQIRDIEPKVD